jgi:hypothetical protein
LERIRPETATAKGVDEWGWLTIRYINKETGIPGTSYKEKTEMSMCYELGPGQPYLEEYVEEVGKTSLCATPAPTATNDHCSIWKSSRPRIRRPRKSKRSVCKV